MSESRKEKLDEPREPSVDEYKRLHSRWMDDRADMYGKLPDEKEGVWAERLDTVWRGLSEEQQKAVEKWIAAQQEYRKLNGIALSGEGFELTPEERGCLTFEGEYDLILAENDEAVVFLINNREVTISTGVLLDCDDEGRFWIARYDAEELGLIQ